MSSSLLSNFKNKFNNFDPTTLEDKNKFVRDERIWNLKPDEKGNAVAIIRLLPRPDGDQFDESFDTNEYYVKQISHFYKNKTKYYNEISRRTWNEDDPVNEFNSELYTANQDLAKQIVYCNNGTRRQVKYYSNIYVINDVTCPENNGKVFIFRFGPQIMDKIQKVMKPDVQTRVPMNPWDFFNGPNFEYISSKTGDFIGYKDSVFDASPTALSNDESLLEKILSEVYSLREFIDVNKKKSYDELKEKFINIMGNDYYTYLGLPQPNATVVQPPVATPTPVVTQPPMKVEKEFTKDMSDEEFEDILND